MTSAAIRKPPDAEWQELRAPLFTSAMGGLGEERRCVVADLGQVRSATVALLGEIRCRLDVIDLASHLARQPEEATEGDAVRLLERAFPPAHGERYDLVLCWNLLNYLDPATLKVLMRWLGNRMGARGRVHALIEYSSPIMAVEPGLIRPASSETLLAETMTGPTRPSPRYSSRELDECMPGFSHERTMLLGNGMQEYLFRFTG